ncbi:trypsin-like peptidase domain-containing protein [Cytobacillus dafuensis]|uniref:Trypsin-like serine protease n=1 Tax=Cytobacillus dafuensis TaxID=1742359 RepID=A0A5B8Z5N2_CYTDA|nr:trypsin-like peptidase domain-containing protein [Cytobacillus dafuensis]QED46919.1 trypsin-like serine protease [Cytobacillus dafuensis]
MIVRTKALKVKLKETQNPLEDFMLINKNDHYSVAKEVLFVRYIGIPNTIELYTENILKIDQYFSSNTTAYLRLNGLEKLSNIDEINRLSKVWENWEPIVNNSITDPKSLNQTHLCTGLNNDTLEWTKKLTFLQILSMYKKINPHSSATLLKNFVIKFLNWMEIYLPRLFNTETTPKVVFIGDIKQHELLFLYFLSRLGCDICYMNPKEDIVHLDPEIDTYSTSYKCSTLYSEYVKIPDFSPAKRIEHASLPTAPITNSRPKVSITVKQNQNPAKGEELSYEQLASLSNSVVMITVYDNENNIVCGGSGVVIHSQGYIVTNLHVVAGGHYYSVLYENETEEYMTDNFIKYHQLYDLAIIKVNKNCAPLTLKTDGQLVRGQKIVAIGSPLGLFNSVSDGIVSGFRDIDNIPMIQFTAPISNGSSGGALLDMYGRLVGLITAGFNKGQNLNLAVPSQEIYDFARNFIEHT